MLGGRRHKRVNTHTHAGKCTVIPSFLSPLFLIPPTRRVPLGGRRRGSLLFLEGRLIPAKSVADSSIIPVAFGSQESQNLSSLGSTRNVGNLRVKPPSPPSLGGSLTRES